MANPTEGTHRMSIRRKMPAAREVVYQAWIDPHGIREWMCPGDVTSAEAVLDVRVNNAEAYCVADALLDRRIPFVFVSGFAQKDMPAKYRACPYLAKPFEPAAILERLREAVAQGEATPLAGPI